MNLKDEMMAIINEMIAPALETIYQAGPISYICSAIFIGVGLIVMFAYVLLYPFMRALGWTNTRND